MRDYYDVCIIGAGVVGSAIARELAVEHFNEKFSIAVIDAQKEPGGEISRRNSGVLHSGLHEKPGSLKARMAYAGSHLARAFAEEHGVPLKHTGMLIAIPYGAMSHGLWKEWRTLLRLWRHGSAQGIAFRFLTASKVSKREPAIRARAGIFINDVWVVDYRAFVRALTTSAVQHAVEFNFCQRVVVIERSGCEFTITTEHNRIRTKALINAAGLYADDIATMALGEKRYTIYPWRGEYYEIISPLRKHLVRGLVYPAIPDNSVGKGIHFSPRTDGRMFLGPNAVPVSDKQDYESNKTPPDVFLQAARRFFPYLRERDIRWSYSGIRPRLSNEPHEGDFIISVDMERPLLINCVGIDSPGFSASMAIAKYIANQRPLYHVLDHLKEKAL